MAVNKDEKVIPLIVKCEAYSFVLVNFFWNCTGALSQRRASMHDRGQEKNRCYKRVSEVTIAP